MKALIIGIDSFLGQVIADKLRDAGHAVTGTSRRNHSDALPFDLSGPAENWPSWDADTAFIAAALTKQKECEENPARAQYINVEQTLELVDQLHTRGIHIVFPSTNIVLPCETPFQPADTPLRPLSVYAQTKADVERELQGKENTTIIRLPKILDPHSGLLKDWRDKLKRGETITAYTDLIISPISLDYAATLVATLMAGRHTGLWQATGVQEISYYDLAGTLARHLEVRENLVQPGLLPAGSAAAPRHPSLDASRAQQHLGIAPQAFDDIVKA